ncbi:MAG: biopolymer transporter ExbD [Acidobacteriia bacterium]|nr:biopolymer transporter ExbD [Terriglobia bacterium]
MAFTTQQGRTATSLSEINVTPLVDVMLVLLVIFMVTAPILQTGIDVQLPETKAATDTNPADNVVLSISKETLLYYGSDLITLAALPERLKKDRKGPKDPIYLRADVAVKWASIVSVIDTVRSAGFSEIKLVTKPYQSPKK